jgi:hypothetical protein
MTIAMCLLADRRMRRIHIKRALSECGVGHFDEDRDGLFGEFLHSRLYFSHNDTGRIVGDQRLLSGEFRRTRHVQMVFHYAPARIERGSADLRSFLAALKRHCAGAYIVFSSDGQNLNPLSNQENDRACESDRRESDLRDRAVRQ